MSYTGEQRKVIRAIRRGGRRAGANRQEMLSAYMTGATESNFRNLPGGDGTSVNWRQETSGSYGNVDRMNLKGSVKRYFKEAKAERGNYRTPGELAQAVQRSAYPGRYKEHRGEALALLKGGGGASGGGSLKRVGAKPVKYTPGKAAGFDATGYVRDNLLAHRPVKGRLKNGLGAGLLREAADPNSQYRTEGTKSKLDTGSFGKLKRGGKGGKGGKGGSGGNAKAGEGGGGGGADLARALIARGNKVDKAGKPYLWGGGHGARPAALGEAVDCSGFVSQLLRVSPRVSGQFMKWGKPGKGKHATVYANDGHVLMSVRDPDSGKTFWYATSRSNPGGGAGRISKPTASYLAGFTARHPGR